MIRPLRPEDLESWIQILAGAYPGADLASQARRDTMLRELEEAESGTTARGYYGAFRDGHLAGGMRLSDFRLNLYGTVVDAGGVGMVAVDLLHKKQHVAKDLMVMFLDHYRRKQASIALLYAFRTDFYKNMGFGLGPQVYRYKVPPAAFSGSTSRDHIVRLTDTGEAKARLKAYYQKSFLRTHGLMEKSDAEVDRLFSSSKRLMYAYQEGDEIQGILAGSFEPEYQGNWLSNNLHVTEFFYDSPTVRGEFFSFLSAQADQLRYIVMDVYDPDFYHLFGDARSDADLTIFGTYQISNLAATGIMYRVLDPKALFRDLRNRNFGGMNLAVRFHLEDTFVPENSTPFVVHFEQGRPSWASDGPYDVEVRMDISTFSSLALGVISFGKLASYGSLSVSAPEYVDVLDALFHTDQKPVCTTPF